MKTAPPPRGLPEQLPDLGAAAGAAFGRGVHAKPMREEGVSAASDAPLRAPWPWFGGKSRCAAEVWARFGDVPNYCEPFIGSGAVLLARPHEPRVETVNDIDANVANAFRAIQRAPAVVAETADQPVNEADLHAVHRWLVFGPEGEAQLRRPMAAALSLLLDGDVATAKRVLRAGLADDRPLGPAFRARMRRDPEYFDAEIAGRWIWGLCAWIGSGWCTTDPDEFHENEGKRPELGAGGEGPGRPRPGKSVHAGGMRAPAEKLPLLGGTKGTGVQRRGLAEKIPRVGAGGGGSGAEHGVGVHGRGMRNLPQKRPDIGGGGGGGPNADQGARVGRGGGREGNAAVGYGSGVHSAGVRTALYETFEALARRLRYVRVACGDWTRVLTDSVTWRHGTTAIFLDPPYSDAVRQAGLYAVDSGEVAAEVLRWCVEHGADTRLRICLAGYDNEAHGVVLEKLGWSVHAWKAKGGYGGQRKRGEKNDNAARERLWFSPGCLAATGAAQLTLGL